MTHHNRVNQGVQLQVLEQLDQKDRGYRIECSNKDRDRQDQRGIKEFQANQDPQEKEVNDLLISKGYVLLIKVSQDRQVKGDKGRENNRGLVRQVKEEWISNQGQVCSKARLGQVCNQVCSKARLGQVFANHNKANHNKASRNRVSKDQIRVKGLLVMVIRCLKVHVRRDSRGNRGNRVILDNQGRIVEATKDITITGHKDKIIIDHQDKEMHNLNKEIHSQDIRDKDTKDNQDRQEIRAIGV